MLVGVVSAFLLIFFSLFFFSRRGGGFFFLLCGLWFGDLFGVFRSWAVVSPDFLLFFFWRARRIALFF